MRITPEEYQKMYKICDEVIKSGKVPDKKDLKMKLSQRSRAVDVSLIHGRMVASNPDGNVQAALSLAHAITTNAIRQESDYFTAIDDLNPNGAAHLNETGYYSGVLYLYGVVNRNVLCANHTEGDKVTREIAADDIARYIKGLMNAFPTGHSHRFGTFIMPSFVMLERGDFAPRTLAAAFLQAVDADDVLSESIKRLQDTRDKMNRVFGQETERKILDAQAGEGSLDELITFATE